MKRRAACAIAVLVACSPSAPTLRAVTPANASAKAELGAFELIQLPTGADVTPNAAPRSRLYELDPHLAAHPEFRAGYAVSLALSPDGKTLALLTSGYNQLTDAKGAPLGDARSE